MQDFGLVSIITPTWNCARFIGKTISSVQSQSYSNWELIIYDDCSSDGTKEVIKPYLLEDKRIKYFSNEKNSGAAITRNNAIKVAKGRWIAFLDSDDLWFPAKLERQLNFMVKNRYHFSYTKYSEIDEAGNDTRVVVSGPRRVNKAMMYGFCWPGCLTVMYDAEYVGLIQIENIGKNNDYAMWLKVIKKADCYLLKEILAQYRRGRCGSVSSHNPISLVKWHYRLFHEAEHRSAFASFIFTAGNMICGVCKKLIYVR